MTTPATDGVTHVDFWFDVGCPYAWQTSRWLLEVVAQRPIEVTWRLMSLPMLKEGTKLSDKQQSQLGAMARGARVLAAAGAYGGQQALVSLYNAIGSRWHDDGAEADDEMFREGVVATGLPGSIADAAGEASYDDAIRASHDDGQARAGTEVGSPVIAIGGANGFFGPVVIPAPTGEDALRLFDAVRLISTIPGFSELKGHRGEM